MTLADSEADATRPPAQAILAAALLAITAFVRVPIELYDASRQDFSGGSGEVLLTLLGAGVLLFAVLTLSVAWLPSQLRSLADAALVGLAVYAWTRAGFFPGPSVNLDGGRTAVDLSTGAAGLLVPLAGGLLMAWLGRRQPRIAITVLAVLLGGSLVQSATAATSAWRASPRSSRKAAATLLEWSRKGNVLIVILDTLQSDVFEDVLEAEPRLRDDLEGFRFYRAASSNSPTTYLSLPTIHSGRRYDPTESARQFFRESIYDGSVLNRFAEAGYRVSYSMGLAPCPKAVASCVSTSRLGRSRGEVAVRDASHLLDLGMYRVSPDGLRRAILERGRGLVAATVGQAYLVDRAEGELAALERLVSASIVTDSPPTAKMIHTMITHPPLVLQPDCSTGTRRFDRAGAVSQARCALRQIVALFDRLKGEGAWDGSDILLIADHGYGFGSATAKGRDARLRKMVGAFNPIVLVKPANERGPLVLSDAPIELTDLAQALCDNAGCSPSEGLRHLGDVDAERTRQVFWYNWKHRYWKLPQIPGIVEYSIRGDLRNGESWSREAVAYTPGTVLDFRRGRQNSSPYLGMGWGLRRPTYQEMVDPQATLSLRALFDPARDYEMVLQAQLYDASPTTPARVTVLVNDLTVGELVSEDPDSAPKEYRLEIPGAVLSRSPDTTITFSAKRSRQGQKPRETMAVQTFELRPLSGEWTATEEVAPGPP